MTHSLHREGPLDLLEKEYVLFVYPARGFNYDGSEPKIRRMGEMLFQQGPANLITTNLRQNMYRAVSHEQILDSIKDGTKIFCVLEERQKIKDTLAKIKEMDAGISIVVSGVIDQIREVAAEIGLDPHTINMSLGIHGTDGQAPAGRHSPVHHHVRPRDGISGPHPGSPPESKERETGSLGSQPDRRGPLFLRDL